MEIKKKENNTVRDSLELLYEVGREFASALDLGTVLNRVLFLSIKNVGATSGSIIVIDERGQPGESAFLMLGQAHDHTALQLRVTYDQGLAGWVARKQQAVLIDDTSKDKRWLRRPDDAEDKTGAKSALSLPIMTREQLVGVITLVHPQIGFFTNNHLDLVQAIADQAGISILNARLYAESQRQARVMTAVAESAAVINASVQLDDVLQRILEQISQALQVEGASLALVDSDKGELEFRASSLETAASLLGTRLSIGEGIAGWVAQEGKEVIIAEAHNGPRFSSEIDQRYGFERKAVLCIPILLEGQVIGVLEVDNPSEGEFNTDDQLVLLGIGGMAGTAIRHAQLFESLQAAHRRYRDLFEDSIDPILLTDWSGSILEANRQAVSSIGLTSKRLKKMTIDKLHPIDWEKVGEDFSELSSGDTVSYEAFLQVEKGQEIPVEVHVRVVYDEGLRHLQWILRDITERKYLDELREDLIAMVYHDLRSPLANVVSSLDIMSSLLSDEDDPSLEPLVKIATRSTERIQRLTSSLLDINRLEAGQIIGSRQLIAPLGLLTDSVDAVMPAFINKEIQAVTEVPSDLPEVYVDVDMIRRVMINLIENAIKFTESEGTIYVGGRAKGEFVELWVKDTGPGIPSVDQERIFDKFTRLNAHGNRRGHGLGLAYCRLAVEGHGGRIWVESESGSGAKFNISIPIADGKDP